MENILFKKCPNYIEMNKLVELFNPVLNFTKFQEKCNDKYDKSNYVAENDNAWNIVAAFEQGEKTDVDTRYYYPCVEFEKHRDKRYSHGDRSTYTEKDADKVQADSIIEYFQNIYNPNFDRAIEIIEIFLQQGVETGIYNNVKIMPYKRHSMTQFRRYEDGIGYNRLFFNSVVFAKIKFNNVLQTLRAGESHFKKSHLSIDIAYMVSSDNEITPYFKIKLPYSSHKKINCMVSFDGSKMYIANDDHHLRKGFIDNLQQHSTDKTYLESFFKEEFRNEIISVLSRTLKIKKNDLIKFADDELRNHFILLEMVKM